MNLYRNSREFSLDIAAPSFQRIYEGPKWLGDRVKHVIEPRIRYRFVDGIDNFDKVIRFDERDLLTNTNEADLSIMNRLYAKDATTGAVREVASLEVWQRRYFDPDFGGALVPGARNVFSSTVDVTPFAFLDQARNASPIVTSFRVRPNWRTFLGWRTDYDPLRRKIVNTSVDSGWRINDLWSVELGHHAVRTPVELSPPSNQLSTLVRLGDFNRRGWNVAMAHELRLPTELVHLQRDAGDLQYGLLRLQFRVAAVRDRPDTRRKSVPHRAVDRQRGFVRHA